MQRKLIAILIASVTSAISQSAIAQNNPAPNNNLPMNIQVDCKNQKTQFDMNFCANQKARTADRKLNQAYQALLRGYTGSRRTQLTTAQDAWIKFRDANCTFTSGAYEGGTIQPMVYSNCIEKMTSDRTKQIEDLSKQREGAL